MGKYKRCHLYFTKRWRDYSSKSSFNSYFGLELGGNCWFSRPPFFMEDFTPEDHQKQLRGLRNGKNIPYLETKRKHKDGTVKEILASYRVINKDDVLAVAMYKDITQEKNTQHKLEMTENCYRTLVEYSPDAIFVQKEGRLSFANLEAVKILGAKNLEQIIGKPIWDFIESNSADDTSNRTMVFQYIEIVKTEPTIEKLVRLDGTKI